MYKNNVTVLCIRKHLACLSEGWVGDRTLVNLQGHTRYVETNDLHMKRQRGHTVTRSMISLISGDLLNEAKVLLDSWASCLQSGCDKARTWQTSLPPFCVIN